jgi:hypothetical protein
MTSLDRIPETARMTMMAAVRTMPTRPLASSRCSGAVQGMSAPPAAATVRALCPNGLTVPTLDMAASISGRSLGSQRVRAPGR